MNGFLTVLAIGEGVTLLVVAGLARQAWLRANNWQHTASLWRKKAIDEQNDRHELVVQLHRLKHRDAGIRSGERVKVRATTGRLREELGL
jgi:hypothetical protein